MPSRKLLAAVCATAIAAASLALTVRHATAQTNVNVGDCAITNRNVVLAYCSNFFGIAGACEAREGRAVRITGQENNGYLKVKHLLASGYVESGKLDWANADYCRAAGIPR